MDMGYKTDRISYREGGRQRLGTSHPVWRPTCMYVETYVHSHVAPGMSTKFCNYYETWFEC